MLTMATVAAHEPAAEGVGEGARDEVATLKEENRMLRQTLLAAQTEASRKHADLLKFVVVGGGGVYESRRWIERRVEICMYMIIYW